MKRSFLLLLLMLTVSVFFIVGCGSDDDPKPKDIQQDDDPNDDDDDPEVSDTLSIIFDGNSSSATSKLSLKSSKDASLLIIKSDKAWSLESDVNWLDFSASSADAGTTGILVGARKNEMIPRGGEITITSDGKSHSVSVQQQGASEFTASVNGVSFKMIMVEGGTFTMGSDQLLGNGPAHQVSLDGYYISETEVTNELWKAVTGALPYDGLEEFEGMVGYDLLQKPVSGVTWFEIMDYFFPEINAHIGFQFNLPTEAQWEYAAMGGNSVPEFEYSGSNDLDKIAWYEFNSDGQKHEVKQKLPNELGIYDMSGNVSEWCADWYGSYDWESGDPNPTGAESGTEKVVRGGDYKTAVMDPWCRVKARSFQIPGCYNGCWGNTGSEDEPICFFCKAIGFRIVLDI